MKREQGTLKTETSWKQSPPLSKFCLCICLLSSSSYVYTLILFPSCIISISSPLSWFSPSLSLPVSYIYIHITYISLSLSVYFLISYGRQCLPYYLALPYHTTLYYPYLLHTQKEEGGTGAACHACIYMGGDKKTRRRRKGKGRRKEGRKDKAGYFSLWSGMEGRRKD